MTFDQLLTFEAIIKTGSFKAAAESLNKTQPSISQAIKNLEEEFSIKLFSRDTYRPTLTDEGKSFHQRAQKTLQEMRNLSTYAQELGKGYEPILRIGIDAVSPIPLLLEILKKFSKLHPETELSLQFEVLGGTMERLLDGDVDLALTHALTTDPIIQSVPVTKIKMIPVIAPDLVKKNKVSRELLANLTQIVVKDSSRHSTPFSFGVMEEAKKLIISDNGLKKELILSGIGWGSLPETIIEKELKNGKLLSINLPDIHERVLEISLLKRTDKPLGPVAKKLWEEVRALAKTCQRS